MSWRWPWTATHSDDEIERAIRQVLGDKLHEALPGNPDLFRNWLAFFLISAFVGVLPVLILVNVPEGNKEVIVYIIGQLSGMATMVLGFYFTQKAGQDKLDAARAASTGKMADAVKAAAQSGGGDADPTAIKTGDTVTIDKEKGGDDNAQ